CIRDRTVFIAGFAMGFRVATFFMSGSMGVNLGIFILMDTLRILITMPISVWAGKYFGADIDQAWIFLGELKWYILLLLGALIGFFALRHYVRKTAAAANSADGRTAEPAPGMAGKEHEVSRSAADPATPSVKDPDAAR
ncbi:MAG: hypothetical protein N3A38_03205, partial [Planctomycetota bacterium]|nr:hypothetical protein [Planctomycetota bacterium]